MRRIFGLETEYAVHYAHNGRRRLRPEEVARHMFAPIVRTGRSSNSYLPNGSRLYLDVGSHPEYASAECDRLADLIAQDEAGTALIRDLATQAETALNAEGITGTLHVYKNNIDSAGNSYGCHENLLIGRSIAMSAALQTLIPFFVTRQIFSGTGALVQPRLGEAYFVLAQRSKHMTEEFSSGTTKARPIINTRDEPHADSARYRRMHVIVGDSNLNQNATAIKIASAHWVLRLIETGKVPDFPVLESPLTAINTISHNYQAALPGTDGRTAKAIDVQSSFLIAAKQLAQEEGDPDPDMVHALNLWEEALTGLEANAPQKIRHLCDWALKKHFIDQYQESRNTTLNDPRLAYIDLAYHDINPQRGLAYKAMQAGLSSAFVSPVQITAAKTIAPTTTRAHMRGAFLRAAEKYQREVTVDWVHLKVNEPGGATVACRDPFASQQDDVTALIDSLSNPKDHL